MEDKRDVQIDDVKVGDKVRSYDFPDSLIYDMERANLCYIEGVVVEIARRDDPRFAELHLTCDCYQILPLKKVFNGNVSSPSEYIYPPVNGTPALFSPAGVCFGVRIYND